MIKEFIKNNKLSFKEGQRNSTMTTLIGFSQFKKLEKDNLEQEISAQIKEDPFIQDELDRLWGYCESNDYANWWTSSEAKSQWKF